MKKPIKATAKVRLDKWLWAARFYKTRSLASQAVSGGKVHLNQQRVKSSKTVSIGQSVQIKIGQQQRTVIIELLSVQRGPAPIAQQLYNETDESIKQRQQQQAQQRLNHASTPDNSKRPNKKQRRQIHRFINQNLN